MSISGPANGWGRDPGASQDRIVGRTDPVSRLRDARQSCAPCWRRQAPSGRDRRGGRPPHRPSRVPVEGAELWRIAIGLVGLLERLVAPGEPTHSRRMPQASREYADQEPAGNCRVPQGSNNHTGSRLGQVPRQRGSSVPAASPEAGCDQARLAPRPAHAVAAKAAAPEIANAAMSAYMVPSKR